MSCIGIGQSLEGSCCFPQISCNHNHHITIELGQIQPSWAWGEDDRGENREDILLHLHKSRTKPENITYTLWDHVVKLTVVTVLSLNLMFINILQTCRVKKNKPNARKSWLNSQDRMPDNPMWFYCVSLESTQPLRPLKSLDYPSCSNLDVASSCEQSQFPCVSKLMNKIIYHTGGKHTHKLSHYPLNEPQKRPEGLESSLQIKPKLG